jgi:hypothetical protein
VPSYHTTTLPLSPARSPYTNGRRNDITSTGLDILDAREALTGHAKAKLDDKVIRTQQSLVALAEDFQKQDELPINMPYKVNKPGWSGGVRSHDKTKKRLLTVAEMAVKAADKAEKAQGREQRQQQSRQIAAPTTVEGELIWVDPITPLIVAPQPVSTCAPPPPPSSTSAPAPAPLLTHPTIPVPTPAPAFTPAPAPAPPTSSKSENSPRLGEKKEEEERRGSIYTSSFPELNEEADHQLLPSTAPAAIPSGRPKRQRAVTDYKALHNTGVKRGGKRQ